MKKKLITAGIVTATLLTTSAFAFNGSETQVDAGDRTPLEIQVDNHEDRIVDLEVKTDETQTDVNQTQADVQEVQRSTGVAPAPPVERVITEVKKVEVPVKTEPTPAPAPVPTPTPAPVPEPVIDPHTVVKVDTLAEQNIRYADKTNYSCTYHLHNGDRYWIKSTLNTRPDYKCQYSVGDLFNETARKSHTKL